MYPEVKALKVGYISLQNLMSLPSLMCLGLMIAFSCKRFTGRARRNRNRHIFSLLKATLAELRKLLQTHMHQWYGREQNSVFFPGGVDGSGEKCQHLCWGYYIKFYSCFLRDASECCGESIYLMSVHVGRRVKYQTRHSS